MRGYSTNPETPKPAQHERADDWTKNPELVKLQEEVLAKKAEADRASTAFLVALGVWKRSIPLAIRLVYAAKDRCNCGLGMAYDPAGEVGIDNGVHHRPHSWECSGLLLGTAEVKVKHTPPLPFAFYSILSENEAPARGKGETTRPA